MAEKQYDVSKKLYRLFQQKQELRKAAIHLFWKERTNPYKFGLTEPPASSVRYSAMLAYKPEYQKPVPKNIAGFILCVILPCCVTYAILSFTDYYKEKKLRSGKVHYSERAKEAVF